MSTWKDFWSNLFNWITPDTEDSVEEDDSNNEEKEEEEDEDEERTTGEKTGKGFGNFASKASSVIGGISGLMENYNRGSSVQDTTGLKNQIQAYGNIGRGTYNNYDQLASDFGQLDLTPDIDEDEIRGLTTGQKLGTIGSGVATGALAGSAFGPIGAGIGAGVGLLTSGLGILTGDNEAQKQADYLKNMQSIANRTARINLGLAHEDIRERRNREGLYNLSAQGGKINRGESIQKFADRVMKRPRVNDSSASTVKVRHGEGGTIIRIKR